MNFDYDSPPDQGPEPTWEVKILGVTKDDPEIRVHLKWDPDGYDGHLPDMIKFYTYKYDSPSHWMEAYNNKEPAAIKELEYAIESIFN